MALLIEKPWRTQPTGPVTVDWTNPLSNGLVFARLGGSQTSVWPGNPLTITGTIIRAGQYALTNGFGSTFGAGTTDGVNTNLFVDLTRRSIFVIFRQNGSGGNATGRLVDKSAQEFLFNNAGSLCYQYQYNTNNGFWQWEPGTTTSEYGKWRSFCLQYDRSSTSNAASGFINGVFKALVTNNLPVGVAVSNTNVWTIGNRPDGLRNWDGLIAETYIWNRILTPAEVFSIHNNPYQIFRPLELQLNSPPAPRIYYVAGPNSTWATPTSTQIINGQLSGGGAATASWSESAPLQTTTPFNFSQPASPLTTGTKYRAAAVQKAGDSNVVSNVVESDPFLAGAATLSNPEAVNITNTAATPKVTVSY